MALHVLSGWRGLPPEAMGASIALGNFDGVHRGHRQVIAAAARAAAALKAPLGVISFDPHPRRWFQPHDRSFRLMTADQLGRCLDGLGVDYLYVLPFDAEMAAMSDEAFARRVLAGGAVRDLEGSEGLGARHVSAGFDITFGQGRTGSPQSLADYGRRYGFGVSIVEAVENAEGGKCSSSAIRQALAQGRPNRPPPCSAARSPSRAW